VKSDLAVGDDGGPGAKGAKATYIYFGLFSGCEDAYYQNPKKKKKKWEMGDISKTKRMNERYGGGGAY
jgi:hypothetical protein